MNPIMLDREKFRDKVYACWLGKNIGGTLGAPYECKKEMNALTFYNPVPTEPLPNDDLDLQLVWLKMLEDRGTAFGLADFAAYWNGYLSAYPWNEYGFCSRNLERGLMPPMSGWFENYYVDEMGSPIRSEIWACIAPADPQRAAAYAWMDSAMDHAGGEGMWGEMFWAAVESAAFVINDPLTLIRIGLSMISPSCSIARAIREAVWCHQHDKTWQEARERIVKIFGNDQPCNAVQNHGFTIIGWLYGKDFGDKLCIAVNCGYDTDCTGATLGSVLGILGGSAEIPQEWSDPVGKNVVLFKFTGDCNAPKTLDELTERTVTLAEQFVLPEAPRVTFGAQDSFPTNVLSLLFRNDDAVAAAQQDLYSAVAADGEMEITLHYGGDPVLYPGISRAMAVTCRKAGLPVPASVQLRVPEGWSVEEGGGKFAVTPSEFTGSESIEVLVADAGQQYTACFTVMSPSATDGFPCATNVETCTCRARKGACLCMRVASV